MAKIVWTGDSGKTYLCGGQHTEKNSPLVEAYGTVDELNSVIGLCITKVHTKEIREILKQAQDHLFQIGADLAAPPNTKENLVKRISEDEIKWIEKEVKNITDLPDLKKFIFPRGSEGAALLHVARSVCRRAERRLLTAKQKNEISENTIKYLNRLSSLLFSLARYENMILGISEEEWEG